MNKQNKQNKHEQSAVLEAGIARYATLLSAHLTSHAAAEVQVRGPWADRMQASVGVLTAFRARSQS